MLDFFYRHHMCPVWWAGVSINKAIAIPMGTNYAPLLAELFLHAYK
jgi:hypothetical protein